QSIFEPFEQVDGSTMRKYGGTGLGLTIAYQLVSLMNGRIWVESEVGQGSRFHFTALFELAAGAAAHLPLVEPVDLHGLRVLVVDDNATNRFIPEEILSRWRMKRTAVAGGRAALEELERAAAAGEPYPLVLLDGMMPDMDGFALAEEMKHHPELAGATVMMLSSADRAGC